MQLSTSTSALDSNLLPLLPANPGAAAPGTAPSGAFADFMPAPVPVPPAEASLVALVQLPPVSVPGGLVCTLAATVPATVEAEIPAAPLSSLAAQSPAPAVADSTPTAVLTADEPSTSAFTSSEPPRPISTPAAARPSRTLSSSAPTLRSARALPRAETPSAENIPVVAPLPPAALSADIAITLPTDLTPNSSAPVVSDEVTDLSDADEITPRPPAARSPWLLPTTRLPSAAPASVPTDVVASSISPDVAPMAAVSAAPVQTSPVPVGRNPSFNTRASAADPRSSTEVPAESRPALTPFSTDAKSLALPINLAQATAPAAVLPPPVIVAATPGAGARSLEFTVTPAVASPLGVAPVPPAEFSSEPSAEVSVATPVENRSAPRLSSRAEKFAAARPEISTSLNLAPVAGDKNFLSAVDEEVAEAPTNLGIDVAKSSATMSAAPSPHRSLAASSAEFDVNVAATLKDTSASTPSAATTPAEITAAAHKAVDAVLASTERLTSATSSSVNLKFSVGGADLDVRVEVRAGAVHATFRTDSPELRTALAQEWQSTNSQPADHSLRLAAPVFAAGDRSGAEAGTAFSGEQSSQARDQHARSSAEFVLPGTARSRSGSTSSAGTAGVSALPVRSAPATTLHLHAFA